MGRVADVLKTMEYGKAPESASLANQWLDGHGRRFGLFVDGAFTKPGKLFATVNPATAQPLARVTQATAADVDRAVASAQRAQPDWAALEVVAIDRRAGPHPLVVRGPLGRRPLLPPGQLGKAFLAALSTAELNRVLGSFARRGDDERALVASGQVQHAVSQTRVRVEAYREHLPQFWR